MSSSSTDTAARVGSVRSRSRAGRTTAVGPVVLVILAFAVLLDIWRTTPVDVSWLIVVGHRLLDGERLYADILETNPPLSVLLYLPMVILERASGLPAEIAVLAATLLAATASVFAAGRFLRRVAGSPDLDGPAGWALLAALTILPFATFAEREHIALIALLPVLAFLAGRLAGAAFTRKERIAIGLLAGFAICIKPQFAAALALPVLAIAIHRRSLRDLFLPEYGLAAGVVLAYAAAVAAIVPDFLTTMLPIVSEVYRPVRISWSGILAGPPSLAFFALLAASVVLAPTAAKQPWPLVLLLAALGFFIAYVEQRKGWPYHIYPALALAVALLASQAVAVLSPRPDLASRAALRLAGAATIAVPALLVACLVLRQDWTERSRLIDLVRDRAPGASVYALTDDLGLAHPLTRAIGGSFQGTYCAQWVAANAAALRERTEDPATRARLDAWIARDRDVTVADLTRIRPEVILVDGREGRTWRAWADADPRLVAILAGYHREAVVDGVEVLLRKAP